MYFLSFCIILSPFLAISTLCSFSFATVAHSLVAFKTSVVYFHPSIIVVFLHPCPGYQAPECVVWSTAVAEGKMESAKQPGPAADVWSLGCVVAEVSRFTQLVKHYSTNLKASVRTVASKESMTKEEKQKRGEKAKHNGLLHLVSTHECNPESLPLWQLPSCHNYLPKFSCTTTTTHFLALSLSSDFEATLIQLSKLSGT